MTNQKYEVENKKEGDVKKIEPHDSIYLGASSRDRTPKLRHICAEKDNVGSSSSRIEPSKFEHSEGSFGTSNLMHDGGEYVCSEEFVTYVTVCVLEREIPLEEFGIEDIPDELKKWELGGITDPLGQAISWLWEQISEGLSGVVSSITNYLNTIRDQVISALTPVITSVKDALSPLLSQALSYLLTIRSQVLEILGKIPGLEAIINNIASIGDQILAFVRSISEQFPSWIAGLQQAFATFEQAVIGKIAEFSQMFDQFVAYISQMFPQLQQFLTQIATALTEFYNLIKPFTERIFLTIRDLGETIYQYLREGFSNVVLALTQMHMALTTFFQSMMRSWEDVANILLGGFANFIDNFKKYIMQLQGFFTEAYNKLVYAVSDVRIVLQGFVNPLIQLYNFVAGLPDFIPKWIQEQLFPFFLQVLPKFLQERVFPALMDFVKWVAGALLGGLQALWDAVRPTFQAMLDFVLGPVKEPIRSAIKGLIGIGSPPIVEEILHHIDYIILSIAFPMTLIRVIYGAVTDMGKTEISIFGTKIKIDFDNIYHAVADMLDPRYIFVMFFWPFFNVITTAKYQKPLTYIYNEALRPEIPTRTEAEDFLRRGLFSLEDYKSIMAKRGFPDKYIDKYAKSVVKIFTESDMTFLLGLASKATAEGTIEIEDWAQKTAKWMLRSHGYIPEFAPPEVKEAYDKFIEMKIYEMAIFPSTRDIISFAVKEVFENLSTQYDAIKNSAPSAYLKFAYMKGLSEYWALAYWDEHWRLVPPEKLADLWFRGEISTDQFSRYLKWHDYRPVARPGFTLSDVQLMQKALYDIPLRIDVRWMIRWGIGDPKDLARIVVMRGMHPDWRGKIISAEWVNNILDERNRLVTSLMNAMEEGIITFDDFKKAVSEYEIKSLPPNITVTGEGGTPVTIQIPLRIRLLNDDEIALNAKRVLVEIERTYVKNKLTELEYLYSAGAIDDRTLENALKQLIKVDRVRESILTKIKARKIRDQLYYTHRQILRTVDAICALYEDGYITREEAVGAIKSLAGYILTDQQIEIILAESEARINRSIRRYYVRAIINRLRRGAITIDKAVQELSKIIKNPELVKAIVEAEGRVYTLSLDRLISMMEYVPVPPDMLARKIATMGVPEDEAKLLPAYAVARELSSEIWSYIREVGNLYVDGVITEQEFKKELDDASKLWGKVRELGVEWVVLSPQERDIILAMYKARRLRKLAREARRRGY